jgi:hypothetical protein
MSVNGSLLIIRNASSDRLSLLGVSGEGRILRRASSVKLSLLGGCFVGCAVATEARCLATAAKLVPVLRVRFVVSFWVVVLLRCCEMLEVLVVVAWYVGCLGGGALCCCSRPVVTNLGGWLCDRGRCVLDCSLSSRF